MSTIDMGPETDPFLDALNTFLSANEPAFELTGPIKVPVLLPNNSYKTTALVGNEEFLVKKARRGAKSQIIFVGTPLDSQPYVEAEFGEKIAFDALLNLDRTLAKEFGMGDDVISDLEPHELWMVTKGRAQDALKRAEEARKEKEQAEVELLNAENPTWGMF